MDYNNYNNYNNDNNDNDADLMRKRVLDEINNNNMQREGLDSNIQSFGTTTKKSTVSFSKKENSSYTNNTYSNNRESLSNGNNSNGSGKLIGIFAIGILAMLVIAFLPDIKQKVDEFKLKRENAKNEKKVDVVSNSNKTTVKELKITDSEISEIIYPMLHVDSGSKKTYLSNQKVTAKDISNTDLIYNGFISRKNLLDRYKGSYSANYCGSANNKKMIKAFYIQNGIQGTFGKNATYKNQNFVISTNDINTEYSGLWVYNKTQDSYVYMGDCNPQKNTEFYLDIIVPYDVKGENSNENATINVKVGFAVVNKSNKTYSLYSDASYSNKVTAGSLSSNSIEDELKKVVSNSKDSYKDYIYKFTKTNCPYREYCFVSAEMK